MQIGAGFRRLLIVVQDDVPTPPGFKGFREDEPVTVYRRNLPHWRQEGATYFVTFRLTDSLPEAKLQELRRMREEWEAQRREAGGAAELDDLLELLVRKQERWLDQGHGSCLLQVPEHQKIVSSALLHFDVGRLGSDEGGESRHELNAYVIMPNHVHLLVRPFKGHSLEDLLHSWKRYSSREINKLRGASGSIWCEESFDRIVRDGKHALRCLQYIGRNPGKAGMTAEQCPRWVSSEWKAFGWGFKD